MINHSITSLSAGTDLQSLIAMQIADQKTKSGAQNSTFSQMLDASSTANAGTNATSTNPSQLLNSMVASYQTSSVQSQGDSLDPMSIAA